MHRRLGTRMEGSIVTLELLAPRHEQDLFEVSRDPSIWRWLPLGGGGEPRAPDREEFSAWLAEALQASADGTEVAFATIDRDTGKPIGSTRYMALREAHRGVEIGWTWLAPLAWGTGANVEAKLLMLTHAFEHVGCIRVEFKTDARNERSRAALAALPARYEGIFRHHMVVPGGLRDSAYFSVIDSEWPQVRDNLRRRLDGTGQTSASSRS
jgi:RimJ/RimL family protein N-acetyltransferase